MGRADQARDEMPVPGGMIRWGGIGVDVWRARVRSGGHRGSVGSVGSVGEVGTVIRSENGTIGCPEERIVWKWLHGVGVGTRRGCGHTAQELTAQGRLHGAGAVTRHESVRRRDGGTAQERCTAGVLYGAESVVDGSGCTNGVSSKRYVRHRTRARTRTYLTWVV